MTDTGRVAGSMLSMGAGAVSAFGGLFDSVERKESLKFKISNKYTHETKHYHCYWALFQSMSMNYAVLMQAKQVSMMCLINSTIKQNLIKYQ